MISEPIDYFEYNAVCIELAALRTVVADLPNGGEILAEAKKLVEMTHRGDLIRAGDLLMTKEKFYAKWDETPTGDMNTVQEDVL